MKFTRLLIATCLMLISNIIGFCQEVNSNMHFQINKTFDLGGGDFDKIISTSDGIVIGTAAFNQNALMNCDSALGVWILKLDTDLNIIWQRCLPGRFRDIKCAENGDLFVLTSSNIYSTPPTTINNTDLIIFALNSEGETIWENRYGGTAADNGVELLIEDEFFIVFGNTNSIDGVFSENNGFNDYFLLKVDFSGIVIESKTIGGHTDEIGQGIIKRLNHSDYLIYGMKTTTSSSNYDYNIISININLDSMYSFSYGSNLADIPKKILVNDTSIFLCGTSPGNIDNRNEGGWMATHDYWVVKLDQNFNFIWDKYFGFSGTDQLEDAIIVSDSLILLAGLTSGSLCNSLCTGLIPNNTNGEVFSTYGNGINGSYDAYAYVVDFNGTIVERKNFGGSGFDLFKNLTTKNQDIYAIGNTTSQDYDLDYVEGIEGNRIWAMKLNLGSNDCIDTVYRYIEECINYNSGLTVDGVHYNESGQYQILKNGEACDTIIILNLTINFIDSLVVNYSNCGPFFWNGINYFESGTYFWVGTNSNGCDSVITLDLTITMQPEQPAIACWQTATFHAASCSWIISGTQPAQPTDLACYETASFNTVLCEWEVTGTPAPAIVTNASACVSYTWEANGTTYNTSGQYSFNSNCQEFVLNLTINQASASTVNATITEGESYSFNGQTLTTAGTYTATFQNVAGCDSVVTLYLSVLPTSPTGCYAASVVDFVQGLNSDGLPVEQARSNSALSLGVPETVVDGIVNFASLGFGGTITLAFEAPIANGNGADIRIDEATWGSNPCDRYPESADVFASQDGSNFVYLGRICQDAELDLGPLSWAQYIRIVDVSNVLSFRGVSDGYDVNGIECLNGTAAVTVKDGLIACSLQEIVSYEPGNRKNGTTVATARRNAANALGMPQNNNTINFVALGFGGVLEAKFDYVVFNQPGNELRVTETSFGNPSCTNYPEKARVSVSLDGNTWTELGEICQDGELDLGTLPYAQYIRIQDASPMSSNKFNGSADGFDVDAVVVLNNGCGMNSARLAALDNTQTADEEISFSLYPNPMEDYTILHWEGLDTDAAFRLELFDAAGRIVRGADIEVRGNEYLFRAADLAPGVYQVVISNEQHRFSARLLK